MSKRIGKLKKKKLYGPDETEITLSEVFGIFRITDIHNRSSKHHVLGF